ncbi:hypothetical protein CI238_05146, partial [Colletotrichum incanum]
LPPSSPASPSRPRSSRSVKPPMSPAPVSTAPRSAARPMFSALRTSTAATRPRRPARLISSATSALPLDSVLDAASCLFWTRVSFATTPLVFRTKLLHGKFIELKHSIPEWLSRQDRYNTVRP